MGLDVCVFFWSSAKRVLMPLLILSVASFSALDSNFHIYLAFGQSNMEGTGTIAKEDLSVDHRFQVMWSADDGCNGREKGAWYDAIPPLANCYGGLGPVDYFGRTMVENYPDSVRIGVVVVAVGGSRIELFMEDLYEDYLKNCLPEIRERAKLYGGNPYARLVEMAKIAQKSGVIKGILLHQGEGNMGNPFWPDYVKEVYWNLINDLSLEADSVPLLAGEVHLKGDFQAMNYTIALLPRESQNFFVVSSEGLDGIDRQKAHFTSEGYRELGRRYAEKMLNVFSFYKDSKVKKNLLNKVRLFSKDGFVKMKLNYSEKLSVKLYTIMGKEILDLSGIYFAGLNALTVKGMVPSGPYIVRVQGSRLGAYSTKIMISR